MANGESMERVLDRIEAHILRIEAKVDKTHAEGCAQRPNDEKRLDKLEQWRDRGIGGIIFFAFNIIGLWLVNLFRR